MLWCNYTIIISKFQLNLLKKISPNLMTIGTMQPKKNQINNSVFTYYPNRQLIFLRVILYLNHGHDQHLGPALSTTYVLWCLTINNYYIQDAVMLFKSQLPPKDQWQNLSQEYKPYQRNQDDNSLLHFQHLGYLLCPLNGKTSDQWNYVVVRTLQPFKATNS